MRGRNWDRATALSNYLQQGMLYKYWFAYCLVCLLVALLIAMLINTTLPLNFDLTDNIFQILPINFYKSEGCKNAGFSSECISKGSIID